MTRSQLNWLRDNRGRIKAYMYDGQFKMVITWHNAATDSPMEVVTETDDTEWWAKVVEADPTAGDVIP